MNKILGGKRWALDVKWLKCLKFEVFQCSLYFGLVLGNAKYISLILFYEP